MADEFEERKKAALAPIFFEAGAALYDCQGFEYAIAYLLYLLSRGGAKGLDPTKCDAILDDVERKTAGQLIHMLRKHIQISEGLEEGLIKALEARNRLGHRYLIENIERLAEVREHDAIVKEIKALRSTVRRSQKLLDPFNRALPEMIDGTAFDEWVAETREKVSHRHSCTLRRVRLTLRSFGPAGTCFDLRSASRRRVGYLQR